MAFKLPKLDKTMKIVNDDGTATPEMQRYWQTSAIRVDTPGGGTSYTGETAAATYDPAQMQRLIDAVAAIYSA